MLKVIQKLFSLLVFWSISIVLFSGAGQIFGYTWLGFVIGVIFGFIIVIAIVYSNRSIFLESHQSLNATPRK
jgi:hypothetical protein